MIQLQKYKMFENNKFKTTQELGHYLNDNIDTDTTIDKILDIIRNSNVDISESWEEIWKDDGEIDTKNILWYIPGSILFGDEEFARELMNINIEIYERYLEMLNIDMFGVRHYKKLKEILDNIKNDKKYEFYFDTKELGLI